VHQRTSSTTPQSFPHTNPLRPHPHSAATGVVITDSDLPAGFKLLEGTPSAKYAKIDVGSKVEHKFVLDVTKATKADVAVFEPAKVTYKADADGEGGGGGGGGGRGGRGG